MKKLILFISVFYTSLAFSQTNEVITVDNADEFVNAIGSNKTIQLKGTTIYTSELSPSKKGTYYYMEETYEGSGLFQLIITGVSNLKIIGQGVKQVEIIAKPEQGNVITFLNSNNVHLENLDIGHGPNKGACNGGVVYVSSCKNFSIEKCIMFGSGTVGLTGHSVENLNCKNSIIRGCSVSIMDIVNCNDAKFENCEFTENETEWGNLFTISNCIGVKFSSCNITKNLTKILEGYEDWMKKSVFEITKSMNIILSKCSIKHNASDYLCNKPNAFELEGTTMENNEFRWGNFKE